MKQEEEKLTGLPENAFRELKPGEVYNPLMSPNKKYPEVNLWSVLWGIAMAILFSAAAAYLGLKVGQVFEAAIPIAIIAVGVSGAAKRKNALGENVIIQSIGASSGVIVAGAIFTLPALYILQETYPAEITVTFTQVFISSLLGGVLGILFLIPFPADNSLFANWYGYFHAALQAIRMQHICIAFAFPSGKCRSASKHPQNHC